MRPKRTAGSSQPPIPVSVKPSHARPTPLHVIQRRRDRLQRLRKLGYKSYDAYLRSSHWRKLKSEYRRTGWLPQRCICGTKSRLSLHHRTYERLGDELLTDLIPLCRDCHAMIHVLEWRGDIGLNLDELLPKMLSAKEMHECHKGRLQQERNRRGETKSQYRARMKAEQEAQQI